MNNVDTDEIVSDDAMLVDNLTEQIQQIDEQIKDLSRVEKRSQEQEEELNDLRGKRKKHLNNRFNLLTRAKSEAERQLASEREEANRLRQELEEARKASKTQPRPTGKYEQVEINGKMFYTDEALSQRVADGVMTQSEAWAHQKSAIKEEAKAELKRDLKEESTAQDNERVRQETINDVLKEYPQFNPRHPDHNPNDPLYKEASRLLNNGYAANPRGIKLAIEDAKKILGVGTKRPDISDDLSVTTNDSSTVDARREKKVDLSEFEQEQAYRLYCIGGRTNPATGKVYTRKEAIEKALKAKRERLGK